MSNVIAALACPSIRCTALTFAPADKLVVSGLLAVLNGVRAWSCSGGIRHVW